MGSFELIIGVQDGNGIMISQQPYLDWAKGDKNIEILKMVYGPQLLSILTDDLGYIRLNEEGVLGLNFFLQQDPHKNSIRMLGSIAEAIIVKRCNENVEINRKWATIARGGQRQVKSLDKYKAIGTALISTKEYYFTKYNPNDTQRDIVWIDEDNFNSELLQVRSNSISGVNAGLQVKVSTSGIGYILQDLINKRYEVPLVYFGISNDFDYIANELYKVRKDIVIGRDFINVKAFDIDAYEELICYIPLVKGLLGGTLHPRDLVLNNILSDNTISSSIIKSSFESYSTNTTSVFLL